MKIAFLTLLVFSLTACFGQTHNIALGVSNNGQLSQVSDGFYFDIQNMKSIFLPYWTITQQQSSWKGTAEYNCQLDNRLEFGLSGGFGQRKESYVTNLSKLKASQQYFSLLPFFLKRWPLGKLQFALGAGFPLHFAGTFRSSAREYHQQSGLSVVGNNTLTGGYAYGISTISRIKWFFTPRFSLMTDGNSQFWRAVHPFRR